MVSFTGEEKLTVLLFTSLFPSSARPQHGLFVRRRVEAIKSLGRINFDSLIPVVYSKKTIGFSDPHVQKVSKLEVFGVGRTSSIRYLFWPRFDSPYGAVPILISTLLHLIKNKKLYATYDVIDAHQLYPDGIVAAFISKLFGIPLVLTARGTDVNSAPNHPIKRRQILWACRQAAQITAVSTSLKRRLEECGVPSQKIQVIRNGFDREIFYPILPHISNTTSPRLLSVGLLDHRKRHDIALQITVQIPGSVLTVVGDGVERAKLIALSKTLGIESRVRFLGAVPHDDMPAIYRDADVLIHASEREGIANVMIESVACGTPVVALDRWGAREVVSEQFAGQLIPDQDVDLYVAAIKNLLSIDLNNEGFEEFASKFSWDKSASEHEVILLKAACSNYNN